MSVPVLFRPSVLVPILVLVAALAAADLALPAALAAPVATAATPAPAGAGAQATAVDINTASLAELDALPGIGPALAQRIVDYRRQNGGFQKVDDLLAVKGVGPKMLAKIRDRLTVGPARTAK